MPATRSRVQARALAVICAAPLVALGLTLVGASTAQAQARPTAEASRTPFEAIVSYDVVAQVQPNTDMVITETIVYDPGTDEVHHGILRDIPVRDSLDTGKIRLYDVQVLSVTRDGGEVVYTESDSRDAISLKIGDPDAAIQGLHTFVISYRVKGALNLIAASSITDATPEAIKPGDIELYWDFIGDQWPFPIYQGTATVMGPTPALAALCFYGPQGSTSRCDVQEGVGADSATVLSADLSGGGGLTGAIGWAPDGFTQMPTPNIIPDPAVAAWARMQSWFPLILILGLAALAAPIAVSILRRRANAGVVLAATPVRYQPPDGVRPGEMQAGINGTVDARGYTATLLDLAARGHLTLKEEPGGMFRAGRLIIGWTGTGKDALSAWENSFVGAILKGQATAIMGGYDPVLATAANALTAQLSSEAKTSGRYNPDGSKPDRAYTLLAVLGGIVTAFGLMCLVLLENWGPTLGILFLMVGIGLVIGALIGRAVTPRRQTQASAAFLGQVAGFRRLIDSSSADARRDYAVKIGLPPEAILVTFLPFAVVLGLESTWVSNFPDVTPEQLRSLGIDTTSVTALSTWSTNMTATLASGTTPPSTTSTDGSGLGGGGSSGGGGGGGGGGSF